jgi:hypothetical protein
VTRGADFGGSKRMRADGVEVGSVGMASMDVLWNRIIACSGEVFHQQRGNAFTYSVSGDTVYLDTANQDLSRRQITEAYNRMPLAGPDDIRDLSGPRYIYGILTDRRIAGG